MRSVLLVSVLGMLLVPTQSAHAQNRDAAMRNRFGAKLMLGIGGEVDPDPASRHRLRQLRRLDESFARRRD